MQSNISLKHINAFLLFYAIDNYNLVTISPQRNRFDIKLNALYNLAIITKAIFKYSSIKKDYKNKLIGATFIKFNSIFARLGELRSKYEYRLENQKPSTPTKIIQYFQKMDGIYDDLMDIIIHFELIQTKTIDLSWKSIGDDTNELAREI